MIPFKNKSNEINGCADCRAKASGVSICKSFFDQIVSLLLLVLGYFRMFFSCVHTTLQLAVLVRRLVRNIFETRAQDARDFQKRSRSRFPAARASRYASHPTFLVANAFALRVFNASYTF